MKLTKDQLELLIDALDTHIEIYTDTRRDLANDYGEESTEVAGQDALLAEYGEIMRVLNIELMTLEQE